jgi:hypothetical protein
MAARWDGTRWSAVKVPVTHAVLMSVACASTNDCVAIGGRAGPHLRELARPTSIRLHDGHWSPLAFSAPAGVGDVEPNSVSCPVIGGCVAVGSAVRTVTRTGKRQRRQRALVLRQRGGTWVARTLPEASSISRLAKAPSSQSLSAVSCPPGVGHGCVAVGTWSGGHNPLGGGLAASLAPDDARIQPLDAPAPSTISCPTVEFCLAAGNESIERFDRGFRGSFFGG